MSTQVGLDDYVSGGYYLTRPVARGWPSELLPATLLSASSCISTFFPDDWAIEWVTSRRPEERVTAAKAMGIDVDRLPEAIRWATDALSRDFGWPNVFYTLESAREARARSLRESCDTVIMGLGLHRADTAVLLDATEPPEANPGYATVGETGIFQCVRDADDVADGGQIAGFELLSTFYGIFVCSWLHLGLEKQCAEELRIRPNASGFVESYDDARQCAEFIQNDAKHNDPGLWLPWLIVTYPC